jgi:hypothetical protein
MPLGPNTFPKESTVTAISTRPGGTSLYLVGLDEGQGGGRVWSKFFPDPDHPTQWTGWFPLGENRFRPGSAVTALSTGPGATSLYVIGLDGQVWTNFFPSQVVGQWSGWMPLGPNTFPKESPIAATSTTPGGTSLYVVGLDEGGVAVECGANSSPILITRIHGRVGSLFEGCWLLDIIANSPMIKKLWDSLPLSLIL